MPFNEHENHHLHEEYDFHMRSKTYEANGCKHYLDLLIISHLLCVSYTLVPLSILVPLSPKRERSLVETYIVLIERKCPLEEACLFMCVHTTKNLPILKHLNLCNDFRLHYHISYLINATILISVQVHLQMALLAKGFKHFNNPTTIRLIFGFSTSKALVFSRTRLTSGPSIVIQHCFQRQVVKALQPK